jgi:hypothetical protein
VRSGFLSEGIMDEYAPAELLISTRTGESNPQKVLVVAKYPDGEDMCVMGDGSIQQISPGTKKKRGLKYP